MKKYWFLIVPLIYFIPGAIVDFRNKFGNPNYENSHYLIGAMLNSFLIEGLLFFLIKKTSVKRPLDGFIFFFFSFYIVQLFGNALSFPLTSLLDHPFRGSSLFSEGYPMAINLAPFVLTIRTIGEEGALTLLIGNALMLTPLAFSCLYFGWIKSSKAVIIAMILLSFAVETVQFIEMLISSFFYIKDLRTSDIDDVILNSLSGLIGVWLYKLLEPYFMNEKNRSDR
ncbi:VanZ family protein [Metabacillus sp. RGM 3146]|uniref:VanZ family protein n=1 Tax=Metabacillus sp. RGM 3146 TaxID=3401092 RepID=UPI003B9B7E4F